MNIKTAFVFSIASVILSTAVANANLLLDIYAGGTYGMGGYTLFADDDHISKSSKSYGAVVGIDIPLLRFEAEYSSFNADHMSIDVAMVNGYFKIPTPVVKPYIGVGIGETFDAKYEPNNMAPISIKDTTAFQGMLGITFNVPVIPFNIDVEGRTLYIPDAMKLSNIKTDILQYEGRVKLRYVF